MTYDWVVVGAGFVGIVCAQRIASELGQSVLLVDRRDHIGGNAYDYLNEHGHMVHRYGPHMFHTNSQRVADYLSQFTEWADYEHRAVGLVKDRLVPIPFNLTALEILFPSEAESIKDRLVSTYGMDRKVPIIKMRQSDDRRIADLAEFIYANVFDGYSRKQWGLEPEELDASVLSRVPVYVSYDDRYFQDAFQKMPKDGYTRLFERMVHSHPSIHVELNTSIASSDLLKMSRVIYTGPIDEFFGYVYGQLEYRSLNFSFRTYRVARHQPVAQVNYPNAHEFTRTTEFAHITGRWDVSTTVCIECPQPHIAGETLPYYPVPRQRNADLHVKYKHLATEAAPNVIFAGRLADYQYYNMDQAVARGLAVFDKQCRAQ